MFDVQPRAAAPPHRKTRPNNLAPRRLFRQNPPHMHEGSITIRIAADIREIERLNRLVRQFGELHEVASRTLYAVNLALDEIGRASCRERV